MTLSYSEYHIKKFGENENDTKFLEWMDSIESIVYKKTGLKLLDLPDEAYRPNFEKGLAFKKVAEIIIKDFNDFVYSMHE